MDNAAYIAAAARLHSMLDDRQDVNPPDEAASLLRLVADDMECTSSPIGHAVTYCTWKQTADPVNAEFWRRLGGSLRKAEGMT